MTAGLFLTLVTGGGFAIGLLAPRYALFLGAGAVVGLYWWSYESATGAFAEGSIRGDLSLAVAAWLAAAIALGMGLRAVVCTYRGRRRAA